VVTIRTNSFNSKHSTFFRRSIFKCFVWLKQTAIISTNSINSLVLAMERQCYLRRTAGIYTYRPQQNPSSMLILTISRRSFPQGLPSKIFHEFLIASSWRSAIANIWHPRGQVVCIGTGVRHEGSKHGRRKGKNMPTALPSFYLKAWICVLYNVRHFYSETHFHSLYTTSIN
jgi:hypothetical protein